MAHKWVQSSAYSSLPENALIAGNDEDGSIIYVGRAQHDGDMLVCKVIPAKQIGFVSAHGEAIPKDTFEVLCGQNMIWIKCYDHVIPDNAVLCGRTTLDQPVYIGRGHYEGCLIPGKVSSVHRALFIPFRGAERRLESYEILIDEARPLGAGWSLPSVKPEKCPLTPPLPPPPPLELVPEKLCPYPFDPCPPYPSDEPPKYTPTPQPTPLPMPQPVIIKPALFAEPPIQPTPVIPADTYQPSYTPATCTPAATYEPPPYNATAHVATNADLWVNATANYVPPNAVVAGHDIDMQTLYVCRAYHNGQLIPGKALSRHGYAMISDAGYEIQKHNFEMLIGNEQYHWVPAYNGSVAPGAVEGGRSPCGEPYFIGRAHYGGSLTSGKIKPSHGCLYIPFGGTERRITNYEVLVRKDYYHRQEAIRMAY